MKYAPAQWLHSVLLVAGGAVLGSLGTLGIQQWLGPASAPPLISGGARGASGTKSAKRDDADFRIQLEQIIAADDREHKSADLQKIGRASAAQDEAAAFRLAAGIRGNEDRLEFTKGVICEMAGRDPRAAAGYALSKMNKGAMQAESLRVALGAWGASNPRDAYEWAYNNLTGPLKEEAINSIVMNWSSHSPESAAKWFEETGSTSQPLLTALLDGWAKTPERARAAAGWVETLSGENQTTGRSIVAGQWASQNPAEAAAHYPDPTPALADVLANIWGASDPAAAAQWVQKLPPGQGREQAAATLASVWAASDIQSAINWSAGLSEPALRGAAVEHLATTWGAIDADKAVAWLNTQPAELRERGYTGAYNSWAGTDREGLAEWIPQLDPGMESDIARRSLAEVRMTEDPAGALNLTLGMTAATQADAAGRMFRNWRRSNDEAAQQWFSNNWSSLHPGTQARLIMEQQR